MVMSQYGLMKQGISDATLNIKPDVEQIVPDIPPEDILKPPSARLPLLRNDATACFLDVHHLPGRRIVNTNCKYQSGVFNPRHI